MVLASTGVTRAGLIGHWRLDEGSGATAAADSGPWGHEGSYHGSPGLDAAGLAGTAMDASTGYMSADLGDDLPVGAQQRTVSLFLWTTESNNRKFIGYGDSPPGSAFEFTAETYNAEMGVRFRHWGGNIHYGGISLGEWNHVAIRVPSGAGFVGDVEVFIDGVESAGVISGGSNIALASLASRLYVGTAAVSSERGRAFNGTMDDVQFYDVALSDDQIEFLAGHPGEAVAQVPQAVNPSPSDGAWRVALDAELSWDVIFVDGFTPSYDVYFGTDQDDLPNVSSRQGARVYDPEGDLDTETTYYWRVDVVEPIGRASFKVHEGEVWSFGSWYDSLKVIEWRLEGGWEADGALYTSDSSRLGNDGRLWGYAELSDVNWVAGVDGNGLELVGTGQYVSCEDAARLPLGEADEWTVNLYVQMDERTRDWTGIAGFGDSRDWELIVGRKKELGFVFEGKYLLASGVQAGVGVWHMVTVTSDANGVTMYVDGIEAASMGKPFSPDDEIDEEVNLLSYAYGDGFVGRIDEFAVWEGVVSAKDIETMAALLPKRGDFGSDNRVGAPDLAELGGSWYSDTRVYSGTLVLDDLEGYAGPSDPCFAVAWQGFEGYPGANVLSPITDAGQAHGGGQAVRWDYDFGVGRVTGFDCQVSDVGVDLSFYDELHVWVYKEAGTTGERLSCKFLDRNGEGQMIDMGEAWYPGGIGAIGQGAWVEWVIELGEIHSWESESSVIPYDRIDRLVTLSICGYSEDGGAGALLFDDLYLVDLDGWCARANLQEADSNGDCRVDCRDLKALADDWLANME